MTLWPLRQRISDFGMAPNRTFRWTTLSKPAYKVPYGPRGQRRALLSCWLTHSSSARCGWTRGKSSSSSSPEAAQCHGRNRCPSFLPSFLPYVAWLDWTGRKLLFFPFSPLAGLDLLPSPSLPIGLCSAEHVPSLCMPKLATIGLEYLLGDAMKWYVQFGHGGD